MNMFLKRKLILLAIFAAVIGIAPASVDHSAPPDHINLIKSSCSTTLYPDLCFSAIAIAIASTTSKHMITTQKDVIQLSLNLTKTAVQHNFFILEKLIKDYYKHHTMREITALHDCLETIGNALDQLTQAQEDLKHYPTKKSLQRHADDLKTLMSAAMTNQDTCLDGFSHRQGDKHVHDALIKRQEHVDKMCSNALAMIKNMTDTDIANYKLIKTRKVLQEDHGGWPEWLSGSDRRILQSSTLKADVVVAADGSGDYKTVSAAVEEAPKKSSKRYVIRIKGGVYRENVEVPKGKNNIMFIGDDRKTTIITANRNVKDGFTTFKSATVAAVGGGLLARGITFENTAGPAKHQAVALRVGSDLSAFYQCDILGYQDSLYVHSNRQFFINCLIAGTIDFIFGNAAVVFQDCDIHARRPDSDQKNMITAQSRSDPNQNTGIVIQKSRIGATSDLQPVKSSFPTYMGRPWKEYSRTVVMQSSITDVIDPAGWSEWSGNFALDTLYYAEYQNTGAGAGVSKRVKWKGYKGIISKSEAQHFTPANFIAGDSWLKSTTFPFSLSL